MSEGKTEVELGFPVKGKFIGFKTKIPDKVMVLGQKISFKMFLILTALGLGVFVAAALALYYGGRSKASQKSTASSQSLQG